MEGEIIKIFKIDAKKILKTIQRPTKEGIPNYKSIKSSKVFEVGKFFNTDGLWLKDTHNENCLNEKQSYSFEENSKKGCKTTLYKVIQEHYKDGNSFEKAKELLLTGNVDPNLGIDLPTHVKPPISLVVGHLYIEDLSLLRLLIAKGASVEPATGRSEIMLDTPLYKASAHNYYPNKQETIKLLLENGANPNTASCVYNCKSKNMPLSTAVVNKEAEGVKELIEYGANIELGIYNDNEFINPDFLKKKGFYVESGWVRSHVTPLDIAVKNFSFEAFKYLIDAGADLCRGFEANGMVVQSVYTYLINYIDEYGEYIDYLVAKGMDLNNFVCE